MLTGYITLTLALTLTLSLSLTRYSHMLTGYIGSASFLRAVLDTVRVGGLGVGHRQG